MTAGNTYDGVTLTETITGTADLDTVTYATSESGVVASLSQPNTNTGAAQGDTYSSIENLTGSNSGDSLFGDSGGNVLSGLDGNDTIHGRAGNDTITGGAGADGLHGEEGDDSIYGGGDGDGLFGYAGNDTIDGGAGADLIDGGDGNDTASYASSSAGVTVTLSDGAASGDAVSGGDAAGDTLTSIENLIGSTSADTLTGDANDNVLTGGSGADTIRAGDGDDTIQIADGDLASGESIDGGSDTDTILLTEAGEYDFTSITISGVETLTGSAGDDTVTMTASQWAHIGTIDLADHDSSDTVNVHIDDDISKLGTLTTKMSQVENVILTGGSEADTITGDQLDAIFQGERNAINLGGDAGDAGDTITLTNTSEVLNVMGTEEDKWIQGVEHISASDAEGGVTIDVSAQHEGFTLTGSTGNDAINGGNGNDTIIGGLGADTIDAGSGGDTIQIASADLASGEWIADGDSFVLSGGDTIDGGMGDDKILLTAVGNYDFTSITIDDVEALTGSTGSDTVTMTAAQLAGFISTVDLGGGTSDVLNIKVSGSGNIFASDVTISGVETGHITGSAGGDTITLTGAQLDAILGTGGTIDLSGNTISGHDTIFLTSTSTALITMGSTDDSIKGVDWIDASAATDGVTINLSGQTEGFTIVGSAGKDAITGGSGKDTVSYAKSTAGVTALLAASGGSEGDAADDTYISIENLTGSNFDDTLIGDGTANVLYGLSGDDVILGNGGDDTVVFSGVRTDYTITLSGSTYTVVDHRSQGSTDGKDTITGVEHFQFTTGDTLDAAALVPTATIAIASITDGMSAPDGFNTSDTSPTLNGTLTGTLGQGEVAQISMDEGDTWTNLTVTGTAWTYDDDTRTLDEGDHYYVVRVVDTAGNAVEADPVTVTIDLPSDVDGDVLVGTSGDDAINGLGGEDLIYGGDGDDTIIGGAGGDRIDGGGGDDVIQGGVGADKIDGGEGYDEASYLSSGAGVTVSLTLDFGRGTDAEGDSLSNVEGLGGSNFADTLTGDDNDNVIHGEGGDDVIDGAGGDDFIDGGAAADILDGGSGDDLIIGGLGADWIDGGSGADDMRGGLGNDTYVVDDAGDIVNEKLAGSGGIDTVRSSVNFTLAMNVENLMLAGDGNINGTGNALNNFITANDDANALDGGAGADTLHGGGGNDTIIGGTGTDSIDGGLGDDTITFDGSDASIAGSTGADTLTVTAAATINLSSASDQSSATVTVTGFENVDAGASAVAVSLTGDGGVNALTGGSGADTIVGGSGADTLIGGAGKDMIDGGSDNDTITFDGTDASIAGGMGIDTLRVTAAATINLSSASDQSSATVTVTGFESVDAGASAVAVSLTGDANANILTGGSGADAIVGGLGADTLIGGAGNDTITFDGSDASIAGGMGIDTLRVTAAATINLSSASDQSSATVTVTGIENVDAGASAVAVSLTGDGGVNALTGGSGADTIVGGLGADTLIGGAGKDMITFDGTDASIAGGMGIDTLRVTAAATINLSSASDQSGATVTVTGFENVDAGASTVAVSLTGDANANILTGGSGADTLIGGVGNDTLNGGVGKDILTGGTGKDTFFFNSALNATTNKDQIKDFVVIDDTIQLENAIFTAFKTGALAPGAFYAGAAAHDADDRIIYNKATGALLYDADGNKAGAAVQFATLGTGLALTSLDFVVM